MARRHSGCQAARAFPDRLVTAPRVVDNASYSMKWWQIAGAFALALALLLVGVQLYFEHVANPRVTRELRDDPDGERARRVMLLTLPSGREIPVNYLREGDVVYAAADGRWWRELSRAGGTVEVLVRGERRHGHGRAVVDDPARTAEVFRRLRPDAIEGFGTLVEIALEPHPGAD